jgi:hypothetical protein
LRKQKKQRKTLFYNKKLKRKEKDRRKNVREKKLLGRYKRKSERS